MNVVTVETEQRLEALPQHVAGRFAVPGASAASEVKVLTDSRSGVTATSDELVEGLQKQPEISQIPLTQAFVGHGHVLTSLGQGCVY